jgi:hypothetical protein
MADFTVELTNGVVTSYSGIEARHDLNARSGVLVVFDGKGKRLKFSPAGWLSVVDEVRGSTYEPQRDELD